VVSQEVVLVLAVPGVVPFPEGAGLEGVELVISDDREGLKAAVFRHLRYISM